VDASDDDGVYCPGLLNAAPYLRFSNQMSNRRSQFALDLTAVGRKVEVRIGRLILNLLVVISIIVAVAIIPAQLADWIA
jgi:hypothetical protein